MKKINSNFNIMQIVRLIFLIIKKTVKIEDNSTHKENTTVLLKILTKV